MKKVLALVVPFVAALPFAPSAPGSPITSASTVAPVVQDEGHEHSELEEAMEEIHRCTRHYVWGTEYWSEDWVEIPYRGHGDLLWKTDYARIYSELFPDLAVVKERHFEYKDGIPWTVCDDECGDEEHKEQRDRDACFSHGASVTAAAILLKDPREPLSGRSERITTDIIPQNCDPVLTIFDDAHRPGNHNPACA